MAKTPCLAVANALFKQQGVYSLGLADQPATPETPKKHTHTTFNTKIRTAFGENKSANLNVFLVLLLHALPVLLAPLLTFLVLLQTHRRSKRGITNPSHASDERFFAILHVNRC